jgi:hypothetical protein
MFDPLDSARLAKTIEAQDKRNSRRVIIACCCGALGAVCLGLLGFLSHITTREQLNRHVSAYRSLAVGPGNAVSIVKSSSILLNSNKQENKFFSRLTSQEKQIIGEVKDRAASVARAVSEVIEARLLISPYAQGKKKVTESVAQRLVDKTTTALASASVHQLLTPPVKAELERIKKEGEQVLRAKEIRDKAEERARAEKAKKEAVAEYVKDPSICTGPYEHNYRTTCKLVFEDFPSVPGLPNPYQ